MSIFIKKLSNNKFEITVNKKLITKHKVLLTDEYHDILTKKKYLKKNYLNIVSSFFWKENLTHQSYHLLN